MKLVTFRTEDGIRHGVLRGEPRRRHASSTSAPGDLLD